MPVPYIELFKREMNYFCVLFKRFEFILGINITIARYGQITIMVLLTCTR